VEWAKSTLRHIETLHKVNNPYQANKIQEAETLQKIEATQSPTRGLETYWPGESQ
jgi:hypothetical protein